MPDAKVARVLVIDDRQSIGRRIAHALRKNGMTLDARPVVDALTFPGFIEEFVRSVALSTGIPFDVLMADTWRHPIKHHYQRARKRVPRRVSSEPYTYRL